MYPIDAKHINHAEVTLDWGVTEPDKLVHVPDKLPIDSTNFIKCLTSLV
jgi:hypothetical protein